MKSLHFHSRTGSAFSAAASAILFSSLFSACVVDDTEDHEHDHDEDTLSVPATYAFLGADGLSSVDYGGQTVRNLLIADIQSAARAAAQASYAGTGLTENDILKYFTHVDADSLDIRTSLSGAPVTERLHTKYAQISAAKSLHDKISSATVIGYGKNATDLIKDWVAQVVSNSQDSAKRKTAEAYLDSNGVDLSQLISKVAAGAVAFHQGTAVYLKDLATKNNIDLVSGKNYTQMEHNWDEAFGYFGAARDYGTNYTDDELNSASTSYKDANGDGKIDFRSEYNFSMMGRYTARRDRGLSQDWSGDAFKAFVKGRALISAKQSADSIAVQRAIIAEVWEKTYASNVVAYIKVTKSALADTSAFTLARKASLGAAWGELKAFAINLQFNYYKKITDAQLAELHGYIGTHPVRGEGQADYVENLDKALALVKSVYGFSDAQIAADSWR
jgi:Domain of unknown function (DUF4856)